MNYNWNVSSVSLLTILSSIMVNVKGYNTGGLTWTEFHSSQIMVEDVIIAKKTCVFFINKVDTGTPRAWLGLGKKTVPHPLLSTPWLLPTAGHKLRQSEGQWWASLAQRHTGLSPLPSRKPARTRTIKRPTLTPSFPPPPLQQPRVDNDGHEAYFESPIESN